MNELIPVIAAISMQSGVVFKTLGILLILAIVWWGITKLGLSGFPLQIMQIVIGIAALALLIWFICGLFGIALP